MNNHLIFLELYAYITGAMKNYVSFLSKNKTALIVFPLLLCTMAIWSVAVSSDSRAQRKHHFPYVDDNKNGFDNDTIWMNVTFTNVESQRIRRAFLQVLLSYETLHGHEIELIKKPVKRSTMQAQPVVSRKGLFRKTEKYKVILSTYVKDAEGLLVADLPEDVLVGWFAHELGHLVDYERFSKIGMVGFGIRYLTSPRFKQRAEHAADRVAIDHGFHDELIATKRFILDNELLGEGYKTQIRRYYMSVEDVEMCISGETLVKIEKEEDSEQ